MKRPIPNDSQLLMGPDAASLVSALQSQCFREAWAEASIRSFLELPTSRVWVTPREEPSTYLIMSLVRPEAEIVSLGTLPKFRRLRLATGLLSTVLDWLKDENFGTVHLEVDVQNTPAQALYKTLGFKEVGRRPNYYSGEGARRDALTYALRL